MMCVEARYFSFNRLLLLSVGLWPYQQSKLVQLWFIFLFGILITAVFVQFSPLLTLPFTPDSIIKILSFAIFSCMFVVKYISFSLNTKTMKNVLTQLQRIHSGLKDKNENSIIKKYGYEAHNVTITLTIIGISGIIFLNIMQLSMQILDVVLPRNVSRSRTIYFLTEYFVDQEKYFFLILLHMNTALWIGTTVVIATGTTLIACCHSICGLFRVASYRIEYTMKFNKLQTIQKKNLIAEGLIRAINIHRQAMKLAIYLTSKFEKMLFCLAGIGVLSLSLNLFRIFQSTLSRDNVGLLFSSFATLFIISYMFVSNYLGQNLTNHNNDVFVTAYNIQWYLTPIYVQKIILFLLQKGTKDFTLSIGGLIVASLKCFTTLVNASLSYFTLIYSMRS